MLDAPTFVTQNVEDAVDLIDGNGRVLRAWPDWIAPDSRLIWNSMRATRALSIRPTACAFSSDDGPRLGAGHRSAATHGIPPPRPGYYSR